MNVKKELLNGVYYLCLAALLLTSIVLHNKYVVRGLTALTTTYKQLRTRVATATTKNKKLQL